jgi:hypothetical protein
MHKQRRLRIPLAVVCGMLAVLVVAPVASANHVNRTASSASCVLVDNVPTVTLSIVFEEFTTGNMPVTGSITLDGTTVKADYVVPAFTGSHTETYTQATTAGTHTIAGSFTWTDMGSNVRDVSKTVECPAPIPAISTTPVTTTTPPSVTPPGSGILPESIVSGRAQLRGPSGCVEAFRARVTGRSIASVAFFLDGKMVKRYTASRTSYTIRLSPKRYGFGRHRVAARVTFQASSGTRARTFRLTFRRCAQEAVAPRFTG